MLLDPPYDSEFTDYGYCSFGKDEHLKLAKCFKETKIKCLMIIGKTQFITDLYKDYIVEEYDKKYRFKLHSGRIGNEINTKHLVIKIINKFINNNYETILSAIKLIYFLYVSFVNLKLILNISKNSLIPNKLSFIS